MSPILRAARKISSVALEGALLAPLAVPLVRHWRRTPARTEVHSLVSTAHVAIYLHAIRSLLRFWPELGVVVHDDGSLRRRDKWLIKASVPKALILSKPTADALVEPMLRSYPRIAELRSRNVRIMQLLDYHLLASEEATSVLGMDSDILFLRRPDTLIDWANADGAPFGLYSPERFPGSVPKGVHWIQDTFPEERFISDICCGFVALRRGFPDLRKLDELIAVTPPEILWHGRFVTQMFYSLLMGQLPSVASMGDDYRAGRSAWIPLSLTHVAYHYFASHERATSGDNLVGERHVFARGNALASLAVRAHERLGEIEALRAAIEAKSTTELNA